MARSPRPSPPPPRQEFDAVPTLEANFEADALERSRLVGHQLDLQDAGRLPQGHITSDFLQTQLEYPLTPEMRTRITNMLAARQANTQNAVDASGLVSPAARDPFRRPQFSPADQALSDELINGPYRSRR